MTDIELDAAVVQLEARFPKGCPSDETVRAHAVTFHRSHWISQLPGLEAPVLKAGEARITVTRQDLFDAAAVAESDEAILDLYVKVAGWGSGSSARSVARCARVLRQPGALTTLRHARTASREQGPVEAYMRLNTRSDLRIKHFGPAFFTKWLYFTGYDAPDREGPMPLILDARVALALGWTRKRGWRSPTYGLYLETVEVIRSSTEWGRGAAPHAIEYALFAAGRK